MFTLVCSSRAFISVSGLGIIPMVYGKLYEHRLAAEPTSRWYCLSENNKEDVSKFIYSALELTREVDKFIPYDEIRVGKKIYMKDNFADFMAKGIETAKSMDDYYQNYNGNPVLGIRFYYKENGSPILKSYYELASKEQKILDTINDMKNYEANGVQVSGLIIQFIGGPLRQKKIDKVKYVGTEYILKGEKVVGGNKKTTLYFSRHRNGIVYVCEAPIGARKFTTKRAAEKYLNENQKKITIVPEKKTNVSLTWEVMEFVRFPSIKRAAKEKYNQLIKLFDKEGVDPTQCELLVLEAERLMSMNDNKVYLAFTEDKRKEFFVWQYAQGLLTNEELLRYIKK